MPKLTNRIGRTFGRWTVLSRVPNTRPIYYLCRCECGTERDVRGIALGDGRSRSCGCLHREEARGKLLTHGLSYHPLRKIWQGILDRCTKPTDRAYMGYGGRGIAMCEEWRNDFLAFVRDIGPRPSKTHSVDRIDNNGNYEPGNCRWATQLEQQRNRRNTRHRNHWDVNWTSPGFCPAVGVFIA